MFFSVGFPRDLYVAACRAKHLRCLLANVQSSGLLLVDRIPASARAGMLKCCGHCNAVIWIDFRGECSGDGAMSGDKAIFT